MNNDIKKAVVRITHKDVSNNRTIHGTGFIVSLPDEERDAILTVYHVIDKFDGVNEHIIIDTEYEKANKKTFNIIEVLYDKSNVEDLDVAVIYIEKLKWFSKEDNMILAKDFSTEIDCNVKLAGLPALIQEEGLDLSYLPINVTVERFERPRIMLPIKQVFATPGRNFEEVVVGMSGGPLYCQINNKTYLLGITKKIPTSEECPYYIFYAWHIGWYLDKIKELYGCNISFDEELMPSSHNLNNLDIFINNMRSHTQGLLRRIEENIYYGNNVLHFNDELYNNQIRLNNLFGNQVVVISGEGGVGKTSFIKHWLNDENPILFTWKAIEFAISRLKDIFMEYGNYTFYDFLNLFEGEQKKYILIDSAEALLELEETNAFEEFFCEAISKGWKVIFTVRTAFTENLKYLIKRIDPQIQITEMSIPMVTQKEIEKILTNYGVVPPQNKRILKLIGIPFYLNEYLKITAQNNGIQNTVKEFKEALWRMKILGYPHFKNRIHTRRKKMIYQLARLKSENQTFYVREDKIEQEDYEALSALVNDEIIDYAEKQGYFFTHDIYEEWSLEQIIEDNFNEYVNNYITFFGNLNASISMRRAYRQWIIMNIEDNRAEVRSLLNQIIENGGIDRVWSDETYIAILESQYCYEFYKQHKAKCIEDGCNLFYRIIFLLRVAEKKSDDSLLFTIPKGDGWGVTILFLSENFESVVKDEKQMDVVLDFLLDWVRTYDKGSITKIVAMIACSIYEKRESLYSIQGRLISIILKGAAEVGDKIEVFFDQVISGNEKYRKLFEITLTSLDGVFLAQSNAKLTMRIAQYFWLFTKKDRYYQRDSWETSYGINSSHCFNYHPQSGYQTPAYCLLKYKKQETLDFIVNVVNITIEKFINSNMFRQYEKDYTQIRIKVDGKYILQHSSMRIWQMYRGTQTGPGLIQCLMAALEKWLIEEAEKETIEEYEQLLKYLIINSKSASITAVVVSAILANPNKAYHIALMLLGTKDVFTQDRIRLNQEKSLTQLIGISALGARGESIVYINERRKTLKERFRNNTLDSVILNYQVAPIKNVDEDHRKGFILSIYEKIDEELKIIKEKSNRQDCDNLWELYLSQMDLRHMQPKQFEIGEQSYIALEPELSEPVQKMIKKSEEQMEPASRLMQLKFWSESRLDGNEDNYEKCVDYETNPKVAYVEMVNFPQIVKENTDATFLVTGLNYNVSCVLLRDFKYELLSEEVKVCKENLIHGAYELFKYPEQVFMVGVGFEAIIEGLMVILQQEDERYDEIRYIITYLLIVKGSDFQKKIIAKISKLESKNILYFIKISLYLADMYDNKVVQRYGDNFNKLNKNFWKRNEVLVKALSSKEYTIEMAVVNNCSIETLSNTLAMIPSDTQDILLLDIVDELISAFGMKLETERKEIDSFEPIGNIWEKVSEFLLQRTCVEITNYVNIIKPILKKNEWTQRFLNYLITKEDSYKKVDVFWKIWDELYEKIVTIVDSEKEHQMKEIVNRGYVYSGELECESILTEYMLAAYIWEEKARKWHSLSNVQQNFYKKISFDLGFHKATLHGIVHLLNSIGSCFFDCGIDWISGIIKDNPWLEKQNLMTNTMFYLERYMVDITNRWQSKIKREATTKEKIMCILNFMVEQGSTVGFMLRDEL